MAVIDIHSHFFPESWPDLAQRFGTPDWPSIRHLGAGKAMIMVGEREFRPVYSACWDPDTRLAEMDRDGVDLQILCATPVLFAYMRPAGHAPPNRAPSRTAPRHPPGLAGAPGR